MYQQGLQGAEFRTLGPVATGGGKQPTSRTARAQRTVRPTGRLPNGPLMRAACIHVCHAVHRCCVSRERLLPASYGQAGRRHALTYPPIGRQVQTKMTWRTLLIRGGVFAQRGHSAGTAPIITLYYPGNTPENHPPTEACMIHSKQHLGCSIQDPRTPWQASDLKQKIPDAPAQAVGCRTQDPGTPWLPVVENSRLFAQHAHSARCAPIWYSRQPLGIKVQSCPVP